MGEGMSMKRSIVATTIATVAIMMSAGPASAFSTRAVAPIRKIPVSARDTDTGQAGVWATQGVWTTCGAIGVDAVFSNGSSAPRVATGQQTYTVSIEIKVGVAWVHVAGSQVGTYRPSNRHHRYEYDANIHKGWHYTYRVLVTNHTEAPLTGTVWVNAAANDNNPSEHDKADCK
jgi:hypothetical protein